MGDIVQSDNRINLSAPPYVVCAVRTDKPLPSSAYLILRDLAKAVETAAERLSIITSDT